MNVLTKSLGTKALSVVLLGLIGIPVLCAAAQQDQPARDDENAGPVYRVGSGVTAPTLVEKKEPVYTERARAAGIEGTVVLEIIVELNGAVNDIRVLRSLASDLDAKAVECVHQWRFQPGQKDGKPVRVGATIEVTFQLQ